MLDEAIAADLRGLLGADSVLTDEASRTSAGTDFISHRGVFGGVVRPTAADQVSALLAYAAERDLTVVPRSAATNLSGGIEPDPKGVALDLAGMNRILEVDVEALRAVVEPGVINGDLQARLAPLGMCFSPDPASAPISTVGGNISENSGGPGCIKYGVTFQHILGAEVVLADGRRVSLSENDDCDLLGLFIGSEGILGVLTQATLRLRPLPEARWTAMVAFDHVEDAATTVSAIIAAGILPAALEFCDQRQVELCEAWQPSGYPRDAAAILFAELDGTAEEVAAAAPSLEAVLRPFDPNMRVASIPEERAKLWAGRLGAVLSYQASGKEFFICDVSVPRDRFPAMIARARAIAGKRGLDLATVGHAGDGNVHPVILYRPEEKVAMTEGAAEISLAALDLGGTITGEHGIGVNKKPQMRARFGAHEVAAFRAIKAAFDPAGILNPEVMLPPRAVDEPELPEFGAVVKAAVEAAAGGHRLGEGGDLTGGAAAVEVEAENLTVTAGAQALCRDVASELAGAGLHCEAMESKGMVGEMVARHGNRPPARGSLLQVDATLVGGAPVRFGSAAVKDVAGLDAKRLLAGGHGRFGRVERAVFRAFPAGSKPGGA